MYKPSCPPCIHDHARNVAQVQHTPQLPPVLQAELIEGDAAGGVGSSQALHGEGQGQRQRIGGRAG